MILTSFMFLLFAAAVNPAQGQDITIKDNSVMMTCPGGDDGKVIWTKNNKELEKQTNQTYDAEAEQGKGTVEGLFTCQYENTKHVFYLKVKVCEGCYELNGLKAWGIITGDLLLTGGVILIVYLFANKNTDGTQKRASNSRSLNPPRPPNPDYEALDPKMRNNAVYSGLNK
ncbi:hypothetical protein Q8A67_019029 [Cirrhinus molitorella]|uniref:T-cell surface glycoprotein CD3 epsilon chain n=1 Tax=Cirrhinus molitorella TaxID=172907 RepID=A0AA88PAB8_9TELE|nr:hypothetical protein Q8A67_019029 [Cirrhinus molitorella]